LPLAVTVVSESDTDRASLDPPRSSATKGKKARPVSWRVVCVRGYGAAAA
jgi:hypothetical protein